MFYQVEIKHEAKSVCLLKKKTYYIVLSCDAVHCAAKCGSNVLACG